MDLGALFLTLGVALFAGLYIAAPLMRPAPQGALPDDHEYSALLARRDALAAALEELELDYDLGKLTETAYRAQKAVLLQQGAEVLQRLDALTQTQSTQGAEERLQAAVAQRRRAVVTEDDPIEALLEQRRRQRQEKAAGFCPQCGAPVLRTDRFCPKCGFQLQSD